MENVSKNDINYRLDKIKKKASEINKNIENSSKEFETRYDFAKKVGIKVDTINSKSNEVSNNLNKYIAKIDEVIEKYGDNESNANEEEYKLLNNILYLDDMKLKNIKELIEDNNDIITKEYINLFANKANDLIRQEEVKELEKNIEKYSKINLFEKITGKSKLKKAIAQNYTLKKAETINKKYVPDDKSLYEIVSIANNCGYKSKEINEFIENIVNEFKLEKPEEKSLALIEKAPKISLFNNRELLTKINMENSSILDRINDKSKVKIKTSEYEVYSELLMKDISTLELFNFHSIVDEVV